MNNKLQQLVDAMPSETIKLELSANYDRTIKEVLMSVDRQNPKTNYFNIGLAFAASLAIQATTFIYLFV